MQLINILVLTASAIVGVYAQGLQINTPAAVVVCQPVLLSWSGGVAPFFPAIFPGGQVSGSPLLSFAQTSATSQTWLVNIAAGTSITLLIRDSTGQTAFSGIITIQAGTDSSCVGQSSSSGSATGASSSASGSATGASSSASASATSAAGATSSSAASSASASTSAAASSATKASSSASGSSAAASTTSGSSASSAPASASTSAKPNGAIRFDWGPASGIVSILLAALLV